MSHITKVTNRHVWQRVKLQGEGPNIGRNLVPAIICTNCRMHMYGEDPDRPVTGCLAGIDVGRQGKSVNHDYTRQESRLLAEQSAREAAEEQQCGARDRWGRVVYE